MNIVEQVKNILTIYAKHGEIHIDFSEDKENSCGLSSIGDSLVRQDILGNQTRKHDFILYTAFQSLNDYDRLNNSGQLLELALWLEDRTEPPITKITTGNGMIYSIPNGNFQDIIQYQLQISVEYDKEG